MDGGCTVDKLMMEFELMLDEVEMNSVWRVDEC